jgi:hypothetical protein
MDKLAVTVRNDSSYELKIEGDPNWDDQELTFNGAAGSNRYSLPPAGSVVVGITADYDHVGLDFSTSGDLSYFTEIGPNDDGVQDVIDSDTFGTPVVKYTLHDQEPLSLTMVFVDIG